MTLGEKSERDPLTRMPPLHRGTEASSASAAGADTSNFSDVVDNACKGLLDRHIKHSIRRIQDMEERLSALEQELDAFLHQKDREIA